MTGRLSKLTAAMAREADLPFAVKARLVALLYTNVGSLIIGHVVGLLLGFAAIVHIGGPWLSSLVATAILVFALRGVVLYRIRSLPAPPSAQDLLRWRRPYQAIGFAWCVVSAVLCSLCLIAGDETMRLVTMVIMLGTAAGIASRGASMPRFALIQIVIWLLPMMNLAPLIENGGWIAALIATIYFMSLRSMVHRRYGEILAMIDAEQTSQSARIALSEGEIAFRAIFENAAAGVVEIDMTTKRYLRVNKVFCDMLGRSKAELLASSTGFTHPDDRVTQLKAWNEIRRTGKSVEFEKRFIRGDETIVWCNLSVSVVAVGSDGCPSRLVSVIQDITKRKAAEAALQASQDLLVLSLDIGGVSTFRRDYTTGLIFCSRETRLMNGLPLDMEPIPAELWLATVLPEDVPRFLKDAADAHAKRQPIVSFDYRFLHPDKGIRFAETRSRVEYDAAGRATSSVGVVIDVTDRRRAESRLAHLAHHDPLTDLPNRILFHNRLDYALEHARRGEPFAILCLDLDHFKDVNDSLGHPVGDSLLQAVTQRLLTACSAAETVARLGGDEFAIILPGVKTPAGAAAFAERITASLAAPYTVEGHRVLTGTSIGIAIAPTDGVDTDTLLRHADMALYGAKKDGRGGHRFFEAAMHEKIQARRALDGELRQALADGALELHYQPIVDIQTQRIRSFEALIRWHHPERGLMMPDTFIPLAEANGLIVPIGAFVLHRACAQAAFWPNGAGVAVNLSASEFTSPDLFDTVAAALRQSALDPKRLELEITESTMLQNTQTTIETLHKLKALGVRISIDDFGTGFSSLGYLQRFPFDKVKIDRSFIAPLGLTRESLAIVGAVVNLCAGLDIETTAEGVETEAQLAILAGIGCTEAQGYYFSRPRPIEDVAGLMIDREILALRRYAQALAPQGAAAIEGHFKDTAAVALRPAIGA